MKKVYKEIELEVIKFEAEDVITASVNKMALGEDPLLPTGGTGEGGTY